MDGYKQQELTLRDMEKISGGNLIGDGIAYSSHDHVKGARTGRDREDSRYIFGSQHQYEYICKECGKTFWVDEERD